MSRTVLKINKSRTLLKLKGNRDAVKTSKKEDKQPTKKKIPKHDLTPKIKYNVLKRQCKAFMKILEENHPDLFPTDGTPPKPWKIHITKDVKKRYKVTNRLARATLGNWQNENLDAYRAVLIPGADRYDLDGKTNGTVLSAWRHREQDAKEKSADPA